MKKKILLIIITLNFCFNKTFCQLNSNLINVKYNCFINNKLFLGNLYSNKNLSIFSMKVGNLKLIDSIDTTNDLDDSMDLYFNYLDSNINYSWLPSVITKNKIVKETLHKFKWEIVDTIKIINNFNCQMAKTSFAGRKFIAWFCSEINNQFGPYKFYGLPGLIFQIEDEIGKFKFEIVKITYNSSINYLDKINLIRNKIVINKNELKKILFSSEIDLFSEIKNNLPRNSKVNFKLDCDDYIEKDLCDL